MRLEDLTVSVEEKNKSVCMDCKSPLSLVNSQFYQFIELIVYLVPYFKTSQSLSVVLHLLLSNVVFIVLLAFK